jgi:hypothetical protein
MSRIIDSIKTRIEKIDAKIKPLQEERESLAKAIELLDKPELPPETPVVAKEPSPHFLSKGHAKNPA